MANSRSARERIRANERKHLHNRGIRAAVRTKVAKARRALLEGDTETATPEEQLRVAVSALDRAASKGVLHPRNIARRKSRLMHLANALVAAAGGSDQAQTVARAAAVGGEKGRTARGTGGVKRKPAATAKITGARGSAARQAATAKATSTGRAAAAKRATGATTAAATAAAKGEKAKTGTAKAAPRRTSSRSATPSTDTGGG